MAAPIGLTDGMNSNGARNERKGGGMASSEFGRVVESIDRRLTNVEQILPTLATKEELREEGVRTRRHFDVVAERLQDSIKAIAEGHAALSQQMVEMKAAHDGDISRLDARVTRLKAKR
ncbi:MAG: hypothetical protein AB7I50_17770 [Vicinamibacterales bacterium]